MNFIYKNLFALPNLRPYTKHKKLLINTCNNNRKNFFFLSFLYYTPNSLCWLDSRPPYKKVSKVGGPHPPWPPSGCAHAVETIYRQTQSRSVCDSRATCRLSTCVLHECVAKETGATSVRTTIGRAVKYDDPGNQCVVAGFSTQAALVLLLLLRPARWSVAPYTSHSLSLCWSRALGDQTAN